MLCLSHLLCSPFLASPCTPKCTIIMFFSYPTVVEEVAVVEEVIFYQPLFNVLPLPFGFASVNSSHSLAFMVSASAFS